MLCKYSFLCWLGNEDQGEILYVLNADNYFLPKCFKSLVGQTLACGMSDPEDQLQSFLFI